MRDEYTTAGRRVVRAGHQVGVWPAHGRICGEQCSALFGEIPQFYVAETAEVKMCQSVLNLNTLVLSISKEALYQIVDWVLEGDTWHFLNLKSESIA